MSFDNRDDAHLKAFAARANQNSGAMKGPVNPGSRNPSIMGSIYKDSTTADNKIKVLSNQRKIQFSTLGESFQQNGGPRW